MTLALVIVSCGRREAAVPAAAAPRGFLVAAGQPLVLIVGSDGAFASQDEGGRAGLAVEPAPFPVARSASSIQPFGDAAIVAVNRTGLVLLGVVRDADAAGSARLTLDPVPGAEPEFAGRTVAPSWASGAEALFLLFRHPIFETATPRVPASVIVAATASGARILDPGLGDEAWALYPMSADSWLVQYRAEEGDRVVTGYARYAPGGTPDAGATQILERTAFERLAAPSPISAAPDPLRAAAAALGGALLVEARFDDGSRRTYSRGDPGEAAPAWGQAITEASALTAQGNSGIAAVIVTDDWRIAVARPSAGGYDAAVLNPDAPVPGARARDAAIVGGLVVVLWEEDLFPNVGSSGILAIQPGL